MDAELETEAELGWLEVLIPVVLIVVCLTQGVAFWKIVVMGVISWMSIVGAAYLLDLIVGIKDDSFLYVALDAATYTIQNVVIYLYLLHCQVTMLY